MYLHLSIIYFYHSNGESTDSFLTIPSLRNNRKKKRGKSQSKKSKQSDIKYLLTIYFQTKNTLKSANFEDLLLVLHFTIILVIQQSND